MNALKQFYKENDGGDTRVLRQETNQKIIHFVFSIEHLKHYQTSKIHSVSDILNYRKLKPFQFHVEVLVF